MRRSLPLRCRPAFTLLELMVVLVLLGLSAALVLPALRLPVVAAPEPPLARARALAITRSETLRLRWTAEGDWSVVAQSDTTGGALLSGHGGGPAASAGHSELVITALGTCYLVGASSTGGQGWDPVHCSQTAP